MLTHENRCIRRDLKPANILLARAGFGLPKSEASRDAPFTFKAGV
jgi:serine/threonine protein kinase